MLHGLKSIASFLGCSTLTVRALVAAGAPVRVRGCARGLGRRGRRYLADSEARASWVRCEGGR